MKQFFSLLFYILFTLSAHAQVSFEIKAPRSVGQDEQFKVQYVLKNADGEGFSNPSFQDFEVLSGPFVSNYSSVQIINGKSSHSSSITHTYILTPKSEGTFKLPAATIKAKGKVYKTNELTIKVTKSSRVNTGNQNVRTSDDDDYADVPQRAGSSITEKDLYFTVKASKRKAYEQEPIMLTYDFHSKLGVGLANVSLRQKPDLKGFWTQEIELPRNLSPHTQRENGEIYKVGTNLQYLVFPQQSGNLTIPSIIFNCDVIQRDSRIDPLEAFFNGGGNLNIELQRATPELSIEVLPLPTPKPANFSGGVGELTLKSELLTPNPKTNDLATFRITISGIGNLKLIKAPIVKFPADFDTFEAKITDKTSISSNGITGDVYFDYTFVPRNVGDYEIPAADFSYFDTQKQQYVTLRTTAYKIKVEKGKRSKEDLEAELAMRNADIRDIHFGVGSVVTHSGLWADAGWIGSPLYFICVLTVMGIAYVVIYSLRKRNLRKSDVSGNRNRKARKKAHKLLATAERTLQAGGKSADFYGALDQALRNYFADKFALNATAITHDSIIAELRSRDLPDDVITQTKSMLDDCDFARYAPNVDNSKFEQDLERASELINRIDLLLK